MSLYQSFKTDENIEKNGIMLEYGTTDGGAPIRIRIARAGGANLKFARLLEQKTKPYRRQLQMETMDQNVQVAVLREVFAESVVLGWENVEDENGKPLPFSKENCIKLFTDLPDLFADVREQANKSVLFRADIREIAVKN